MANADNDILFSTSLEIPRELNDEETVPPSHETHSEMMYVVTSHKLNKVLAILTIGLINNDVSTLFNPSVLSCSTALWPSALKLTAKDLKAEIERHCDKSCVAGFTAANVP